MNEKKEKLLREFFVACGTLAKVTGDAGNQDSSDIYEFVAMAGNSILDGEIEEISFRLIPAEIFDSKGSETIH